VSIVGKAELARLAGPDAVHQGLLAKVRPYEYSDLPELLEVAESSERAALFVVLDGITDPHNVGAILRSAYLFGAHGVIIPENRAAKVNAVVTKSSAGASELISVALVKNLARAVSELKEAGVWTVALAAGPEAVALDSVDATSPLALVMGAEGAGVRRMVLAQCDHRAALPMIGRGVGSYNVSVATGVALYEVTRQRQAP